MRSMVEGACRFTLSPNDLLGVSPLPPPFGLSPSPAFAGEDVHYAERASARSIMPMVLAIP